MDWQGWVGHGVFCLLVLGLTAPIGGWMDRVFGDRPPPGLGWLAPIETMLLNWAGPTARGDQGWRDYLLALLLFHFLGIVLLTLLLMGQGTGPINPAGLPGLPIDLAINIAISFVTNTNWQAYRPEATLSPFSQMVGLTVQNFLSAAVGLTVSVALIRAISQDRLGNFWTDLVRSILYVLLPACLLIAPILIALGVPQSLSSPVATTSLEGVSQTLPLGPVASQIAIKHLGTNGGGYFTANAAHPFENPNLWTNVIALVSIFALGAGLTAYFGRRVGDRRQGWALLATMGLLFACGLIILSWAEATGGTMEGKETRFGLAASTLFTAVTTAASSGATNTALDSLAPLAGLVALMQMQIGEVIIGGVGSGLYGMLVFVLLAVFIAGLMIGRAPEYLGKKIDTADIQLAVLASLITPATILLATALLSVSALGAAAHPQAGPHGFTQLLYAATSAAANNGSAFAGLTTNQPGLNMLFGLLMLLGRLIPMIAVLALAGRLAAKPRGTPSPASLPTHGPIFVLLLTGIVILLAGLEFLPALVLGPGVEHLLMRQGVLY